MLKNIVFDVGNVLTGFDWPGYLQELFPDPELAQAVDTAIFQSGLWNELNRNVMPEELVFERMREYDYKHRKEIVMALSELKRCLKPVPYAIPWLKELKEQGYNLYYLSNYSPLLLRTCKEALEFILYTDGGCMSCDLHLIKPDRAIYSAFCHIYRLEPSECIFIDDREANVQAAINFGMQGLVFHGYATTKDELAKLLEGNK